MGVGKVGGGGRKGGAGGAKGSGAASGPAKASGAGFAGKVDKYEKLVGPSGAAGSSNVGGVGPMGAADPVTAKAMEIVGQLKAGLIKTKEEATKKLVAHILKDKVRINSKALADKISEFLQDEGTPVHQALERLWAKAKEQ